MATWTFQQRGRASHLKTLTLDDYNAPFGRARKEAVIVEEVTVNVQTTNYPGSKSAPTRHIFGSYWEPTTLKGRWMTKMMADGRSAGSVADEWLTFVREEMPLTVSWGNIAAWEGFIQKLKLYREDEHNIAWEMTVLLDERTDLNFSEVARTIPSVNGMVESVVSATLPIVDPPIENVSFDIFTQLDSLIGILKGYTATLVDFANLADSIEKQAFSTIQSFRNVIANIESALTEIQLVVANGVSDSVLLVRRTESDLKWYRYCLDTDVAVTTLKSLIMLIDRTVEASIVSTNAVFVQALDGDTWEAISTRATGGPNAAASIREENGIKYGTLPTPGESYIVSAK